MPDYRTLLLSRRAPQTLAPSGGRPLKATSRQALHRALKALDTLPQSGPRVLGEWGLRGGDKFLIADGEEFGGMDQVYPDTLTPRVVLRGRAHLIPGHFVGAYLTAIPSGPSVAYSMAFGTYNFDAAGGSVVVEVTYTNSDAQSISVSFELDLPASNLLYNQEPPFAHGSCFNREGVAFPAPLVPSLAEWQKWSRGLDVVATFTVSEIGGARVVDGVVTEVPREIVVDLADDLPTCMYSLNGQPYQQLPSDYPLEQLSSTDTAGGMKSIYQALRAHGRQLGPYLFGSTLCSQHGDDLADWVSYDGGTGDDEGPPCSVNGTTFTACPLPTTTPDDNLPGWGLTNYARQVNHGDQFLDGNVGVISVYVVAYVRVSAGTGTYELRTDDVGWGIIRWTTTSTTWTTVVTYGTLECGVGPGDLKVARLWMKNSGANDTEIRYLSCYFAPRP